ncbi:unnamed protein product [Vitrella brassicaformis CCMP3155]|uniref:Cyclic nucleotide-binding domain-containing protein n=3 Tax=Vitrella brassicaformis TaxID=1169539 RepID=A0A0G4EWS2_VITBC|nr:unnamed protein product [Vitrella brassicaformis CCMP3155]|eukprot:CEM02519.1 unnamed protein product [Vitrella brassicaformis CCMP3155]
MAAALALEDPSLWDTGDEEAQGWMRRTPSSPNLSLTPRVVIQPSTPPAPTNSTFAARQAAMGPLGADANSQPARTKSGETTKSHEIVLPPAPAATLAARKRASLDVLQSPVAPFGSPGKTPSPSSHQDVLSRMADAVQKVSHAHRQSVTSFSAGDIHGRMGAERVSVGSVRSWRSSFKRLTSGRLARMRSALSGSYPGMRDIAHRVFGTTAKDKVLTKAKTGKAFHPTGRFRRIWNIIVSFFIVLDIIIIPIRVAFYDDWGIEPDDMAWENLLMLALCLLSDVLMVADLCVNFLTGYVKEGHLVLEKRAAAWHYLKTRFFCDLIGTLPLDFLGYACEDHISQIRTLRYVRLLRICRLVRYMHTELVEIRLKTTFARMTGIFSFLVLFAHIMACFSFLTARFDDFHPNSWVALLDLTEATRMDQYTWALFYSASHTLSIGYGRDEPRLIVELWLTTVSMTIGAALFSGIIGLVAGMMSHLDAAGQAYERHLDELNHYMAKMKLPLSLQHRMRLYHEVRWPKKKMFDEEAMQGDLSHATHIKVCLHSAQSLIASNPILSADAVDRGFLVFLVKHLKATTFVTGDSFFLVNEVPTHLYFVVSGCVKISVEPFSDLLTNAIRRETVRGHPGEADLPTLRGIESLIGSYMYPGSFFGETALVYQMKHPYSAQAIEDCSVMALRRDHFFELMDAFPDMFTIIREVAYHRVCLYQERCDQRISEIDPVKNGVLWYRLNALKEELENLQHRFDELQKSYNQREPSPKTHMEFTSTMQQRQALRQAAQRVEDRERMSAAPPAPPPTTVREEKGPERRPRTIFGSARSIFTRKRRRDGPLRRKTTGDMRRGSTESLETLDDDNDTSFPPYVREQPGSRTLPLPSRQSVMSAASMHSILLPSAGRSSRHRLYDHVSIQSPKRGGLWRRSDSSGGFVLRSTMPAIKETTPGQTPTDKKEGSSPVMSSPSKSPPRRKIQRQVTGKFPSELTEEEEDETEADDNAFSPQAEEVRQARDTRRASQMAELSDLLLLARQQSSRTSFSVSPGQSPSKGPRRSISEPPAPVSHTGEAEPDDAGEPTERLPTHESRTSIRSVRFDKQKSATDTEGEESTVQEKAPAQSPRSAFFSLATFARRKGRFSFVDLMRRRTAAVKGGEDASPSKRASSPDIAEELPPVSRPSFVAGKGPSRVNPQSPGSTRRLGTLREWRRKNTKTEKAELQNDPIQILIRQYEHGGYPMPSSRRAWGRAGQMHVPSPAAYRTEGPLSVSPVAFAGGIMSPAPSGGPSGAQRGSLVTPASSSRQREWSVSAATPSSVTAGMAGIFLNESRFVGQPGGHRASNVALELPMVIKKRSF